MVNELKKENIKARLIKYVADIWGYKQSDIDGFDPVIDLLLGACAVEFERIGNSIQSSQSRTLEKLANLLLPEGLTIPRPTHTILKAQGVERLYHLKREDQFTFEKEIINSAKPTELQEKTIYFSPVNPHPLYNASLDYIAVGNNLYEQQNFNLREHISKTISGNSFPENHIWLGINTNGLFDYLPPFTFFFDWKNNPKRTDYLDLLPVSRWYLNGDIPLNQKTGYAEIVEKIISESKNKIVKEWDVLSKIENKVNQLYKHQFISLREQNLKTTDHLHPYPEEFTNYFDPKILKKFDTPLLWIKLEVSQLIPLHALKEMECDINCFPAINRQLIDNRRPYRMDNDLSIIPLKTDDYFLTMNKVTADDGLDLNAVPFYNIHDLQRGTYTVRKNSVGRFDSRNARAMLDYILELLRDENAAFSAIGGTVGSKDIQELDKKINKIEVNLKRKSIDQDITHFLMLNPGKISQVYISFWSTCGTIANKIPSGTTFDSKVVDINSKSIISVTRSSGGRDKPTEQERIYSFRNSLLSRDRIVTKQDIITACHAELGNAIKEVKVQKGYKNFTGISNGVSRVIEVKLSPRDTDYEKEEWDKICADLANVLAQRSSLFVPILVKSGD